MIPQIHKLPRTTVDDYCAVYRERDDGDWDFVACFSFEGTFPQMGNTDDAQQEMIDNITEAIKDEGADSLIVWYCEPDFPQTYEYTKP